MNYYSEIKKELINNEITKRVKDYSKNKSDLNTYYNVGKILAEAGKHYGEGIIKEYSERLIAEVSKRYSVRLLFRMRKMYNFFEQQKLPTLSAVLTVSHYDELLKIKDINEINYYVKIIESQNLSVREIREKIKNKEYERLDYKTKEKLIKKEEIAVSDFIKNSYDYKEISEKVLQKLILEDIPSFLEELGDGFTFIKNEYKIKVGDRYNYIDLLLFNYVYNCFIVVELKVTELKKEHIGQIETYMHYIDKNIKRVEQNKTIGIIILRKDNKFIMEYCSDERILTRIYEFV